MMNAAERAALVERLSREASYLALGGRVTQTERDYREAATALADAEARIEELERLYEGDVQSSALGYHAGRRYNEEHLKTAIARAKAAEARADAAEKYREVFSAEMAQVKGELLSALSAAEAQVAALKAALTQVDRTLFVHKEFNGSWLHDLVRAALAVKGENHG